MKKEYSVILADDDSDDRELFIELLSHPDTNVGAVSNGTELLQYLNGLSHDTLPDCIFLDLNMPVMGGKECLKHIRSHEQLKHIPIIIYSTSSNNIDIEETFDLGANLYLIKESSYGALQKSLKSIVNLDWNAYSPKKSRKDFVFK